MPYDGLTIRAIASELDKSLFNARIDKIHQPEKDEIVLSIRQARGGTVRLLISANARWARMHLTSDKKPNPAVPSGFCMLLRKYLEGGKIKSVRQVDFERLVHIEIEALDEFREWKTRLLICEFMGRHSNIILVNPENNAILDGIKKFGSDVSSYREVLPGRQYVAPPSQGKLNPLAASAEIFATRMWEQSGDFALATAFFQVYSGISPFSARELCLQSCLSPDLPVEECGEFELSTLYRRLQTTLDRLNQGCLEPFVAFNGSTPQEFAPYPISSAEGVSCASMNEACDLYFSSKLAILRLESMKVNLSRNIKSTLDRAYKKKYFQEGDLEQARRQENYRTHGELLTAYAHEFKKGDLEAVLQDFYTGETVVIELDPRYTPIQNAQRYFRIYNKSRKTIQHLETFIQETGQEIDYLESVLQSIQQAESPADIEEIVEELENEKYMKGHQRRQRKTAVRSKPRHFLSSDGLDILVGRNNRQNDLLTIKQADSNDLWLHTRNIPGTHVIVKMPRHVKSIHDVPDATLEEAASLAAYFSKARQSEKVEVDYTFRSNVRKPGGARPGMVIYENHWTLVVNPSPERLSALLATEQK